MPSVAKIVLFMVRPILKIGGIMVLAVLSLTCGRLTSKQASTLAILARSLDTTDARAHNAASMIRDIKESVTKMVVASILIEMEIKISMGQAQIIKSIHPNPLK